MEIFLIIVVTVILAIFGFSLLGIILTVLGKAIIGVFKLIKIVFFLAFIILGIGLILAGVSFPTMASWNNMPPPNSTMDAVAFWAIPLLLMIAPGILLTKVGWSGLWAKDEKISRPYVPSSIRTPDYDSYDDDDARKRFREEWDEKRQEKQEKDDRENEQYWEQREAEDRAEKESKEEAWRQDEQAKDDYRREQEERWEQN